jgi:hypothetical protein
MNIVAKCPGMNYADTVPLQKSKAELISTYAGIVLYTY